MKKELLFFLFLFFFYVFTATASENLFQLKAPDIDGNQLPLSEFKGQVVLVVNTASKCGFTYQYVALERIYRKYRNKGFVVLGFPSDDFWQELDSNEEIKEFCEGYQISFPLFAVGPLRGSYKLKVFRFLTSKNNSRLSGEVRWNFEKFLVNREGKLVERYSSFQNPDENPLIEILESLL